MSSQALTTTNVMWTTNCYSCGVEFGMPRGYYQDRLDDHKSFYCPNGHSQYFTGKTEAEKQKQLRIRAEARAAVAEDQAEVAKRSAVALRGHLTRLRNRIANGVCPWCKRSFKDVLAHVGNKHPEHSGLAHKAVDA